jgi:hypothetical protein
MNNIPLKKIILAGLLVGTLDITAASIQFYIKTSLGPGPVLRYIAGAVFGPSAAKGGYGMMAAGLLFHYIIAMGFTLLFFGLYRLIPSLSKQRILTGIVYGIFMWCFMNFIVLPLSRVPNPVFHLNKALVATAILIVCIGFPLSFLAARWSKRTTTV